MRVIYVFVSIIAATHCGMPDSCVLPASRNRYMCYQWDWTQVCDINVA